MKIILVIPYNPLIEMSGLELATLRFAEEFSKTGNKTTVFTKGMSGEWKNKVPVVGFPDIQAIGRWLFENPLEYDVILWMEIFPETKEFETQYLWSFLLKKYLHKSVYLMVATLGNMKSRGGGNRWYELLNSCMDGFIVWNDAQITELGDCGLPTNRVHKLASGVDTLHTFRLANPGEKEQLRRAFGWDLNKVYFLFVGRFVERKRPDFLLKIWADLPDIHPYAELAMLGSGMGHDDSIESVVKELAWRTPFCTLIPPTEDVASYYRAADVLVIPSVREGEPVVVSEAMASGLPIIASNISGLASVIQDRKTGLICESQDPVSFGNAMRYLTQNPDIRSQMAHSAREFSENERDIRMVAQKYLKLFNENL